MIKNKRILQKIIQSICVISLALNIKEFQLIKKNKELKVASYIDKITGLPGRRSCEEKTNNIKEISYASTSLDSANL